MITKLLENCPEVITKRSWLRTCNLSKTMSLKPISNVFRMISPSKLLTTLIFFQSTNCFADYQALFQDLVNQKQEQVRLLEQNRAPKIIQEEFDRKKLELDSKLKDLQAQLSEIVNQIAVLDKEILAISEHQEMPRKDLDLSGWDQIFSIEQIGTCSIKSRDKDGFYEIYHKNGDAIRFKPSEDIGKETSSFAIMIGSVENPAVEVTQPGFKLKNSKEVNMEAKLQYTLKENTLVFGHVGILGERIKDRTFGGSTFKPRRLICNTGFTPLN